MREYKTIGFELRVIQNMIARKLNATPVFTKLHELTGTHGYVINYLMDHLDEDVFQKDIEQAFSVRRSTASGVLNLMEKNGLIERHEVMHDARLKKLVLTPKAIELSNSISAEIERTEEAALKGISQKELDTFYSVLDQMRNNLEKQQK